MIPTALRILDDAVLLGHATPLADGTVLFTPAHTSHAEPAPSLAVHYLDRAGQPIPRLAALLLAHPAPWARRLRGAAGVRPDHSHAVALARLCGPPDPVNGPWAVVWCPTADELMLGINPEAGALHPLIRGFGSQAAADRACRALAPALGVPVYDGR